MTKPEFKSRENAHVVYQYESPSSGTKVHQEYWISRAVANVAFIFAKFEGEPHILITKRSETMMDSPGLYCVPCGYLNWDENGYDSMVREAYEETGFYIPSWEEYNVFDNNKQPFCVLTEPDENRQNVSHLYVTVFLLGDNQGFIMGKGEDNEASEVRWMTMREFENNNLKWAFNHDKRIKQAFEFYKANR